VADYFWEYMQDAVKKEYMVYGNPILSAPDTEFELMDRYSDSNRSFLNFCSYNYLGYALRPEVQRAIKEAVVHYGTGAVSAPLLSGYYDVTQKLEKEIARFKQKDSAVIFPTGYSSNLGILSALLSPGDIAVLDMLPPFHLRRSTPCRGRYQALSAQQSRPLGKSAQKSRYQTGHRLCGRSLQHGRGSCGPVRNYSDL
jgi:glycine C-acetyltransferase